MIFSKIEKTVYDLVLPIAESRGYGVYDVMYVKEGPHWFLRVYIDRENGVDVDDCEIISRSLSTVLDEKNFIDTNYFLEISSPGIERIIRQEEHFDMAVGKEVKIKLYRAVDGKKEIDGTLTDAGKSSVFVSCNGGNLEIDKKNIAKANIRFEF